VLANLAAACASVLALAGAGGPAEAITVSAAISLTDVMQEIGQLYTSAGGGPVRFNFAGSNALARQIANGASVDVFVSADDAQMDVVERAGLVMPGTRSALVRNRLAVVVPSSRPRLHSVDALAAGDFRRIAMGDPEAVPAGVYAKRYLRALGLWDALQPRVVPSRNVRAALAAVENGTADAAIVYATDARRSAGLTVAIVVEGAPAPPIVYPACVVRTSRHAGAARQFAAFLASAPAAQAFERHGFIPLHGPR
jgi:molybdate transport system substrate-binding protein